MGNLPVVIPFFQMQTPLQHLPAWLLSVAFGQLLFIFCPEFIAVICTGITSSQKPILFLFWVCLYLMVFSFLLYYLSLFSSLGPQAVLLVPRDSQPLLTAVPTSLIFLITDAQIKSKGTDRGENKLSTTLSYNHTWAFSSKWHNL